MKRIFALQHRTNNLISASLLAAMLVALVVLPAMASAEVQFDDMKWYVSSNPESLRVNDQGNLEWTAPNIQQLIVRLGDIRLTEIGDIAEMRYLCKFEGPPQATAHSKPHSHADDSCLMPAANYLRIGLFDSNGKGHIEKDGFGHENDIWKGYLGYYAHLSPHIPENAKCLAAEGKKANLPCKYIKRTNPDHPGLLELAAGSRINRCISGFGAPMGRFVPLFIQAKRAGPGTVHVTMTIDNVSYLRMEEAKGAALQPPKIDVFSISFPGLSPYTKVTLAPISAAKSLLEPPLKPTSMKHVNVYKEPGRFGGWPAGYSANQWIWGNEIMVAFRRGYYKPNPTSHNIDGNRPSERCQARSLDGGETWTLEESTEAPDKQNWPDPTTGPINFTHPDFAMKVGGSFSFSYDRGRTWKGRYKFKGIDFGMTSRHAYMVESQNECLFWLSAGQPGVNGSNHSDRSFMARTIDGGQTFKLIAWLTDQKSIRTRSVMPSAARLSPSKLVATTRRKLKDDHSRKNSNWIEASVSNDNGQSWQYLSKVADTDRGEENGSPPAMVALPDGRLVVAYGYRSYPLGIRAKISNDEGKTWSDEIVLRDDGNIWDLGYPRMMLRPDGKLVTIYYHNTPQHPAMHIVATIWDPDTVERAKR